MKEKSFAKKHHKLSWKPGNVLSPLPVVMVSCGGSGEWKENIITIAWTGTVCSTPPMVSISIQPKRHSYDIIKSTGEFIINVPTPFQAKVTDWCGVVSGRDVDKFSDPQLTAGSALELGCPIICECPINIECAVQEILELGSHSMFVARVVGVQVSSEYVEGAGKFLMEKTGLLAYALGNYYSLGKKIDHFGFSIRKKKKKKRKK